MSLTATNFFCGMGGCSTGLVGAGIECIQGHDIEWAVAA